MYSTSRRVLLRPLLRQAASRIPRHRCIATAEPSTPSRPPETDLENLAGPIASTSTSASASLFAPLPDDPAIDNNIDDVALPEEYLENASDLVDPEQSSFGKTAANKSNEKQLSKSIQVYPELKAINMPGILTIVRAIESRFGPVREFRMVRDKDVPGEYLRALYLIFANKESTRKIQDSGTSSMVIPIARWDRVKDGVYGGVGLDELQAQLRPTKPASTEDSSRVDEARVEADVGAVEDALNAAEGKPAETATDTPASLPDMEPCECRIDILPKYEAFVIKPFTFDRTFRTVADSRERISRSLIRWGGFYQGSQSVSEAESEEDKSKMGMGFVDRLQLEETNEERARREIQAMILRSKDRLKDMGLDWNVPPPLKKRKEEADTSVTDRSQDKPEAVEADSRSAEPVEVLDSPLPVTVKKPIQTKPKAKALTPEEEQLFRRLSVRTPKKVTTEPKPATTTSSTPAQSFSIPQTQKVQKPKAPSTPPVTAAAPSSSSSSTSSPATSASPSSDAKAKEIENNRARRAARKAEEEERAGFKAKLLGWMGR